MQQRPTLAFGSARPDQRRDRLSYALFLCAFALLSLGGTWDVAWHAAWHAETVSAQRGLNLVGLLLAVAALACLRGADLAALRLLRGGIVVYLVALPLEALNHRSYGVDASAWSLAHLMLGAGVLLIAAGVLRGALRDGAHWVVPPVLLCCLDALLLPASRPEEAGWWYPVYAVLAASLLLLAACRVTRTGWTASLLGVTYLGYRCLTWLLFSGTDGAAGGPTIPFWLLPLCLVIDLVARGRWHWPVRITLGALLLTAVGHTALALQSGLLGAPTADHHSAVLTAGLLIVAWSLAERWYQPRTHHRLVALLSLSGQATGRWTAGSRRPG